MAGDIPVSLVRRGFQDEARIANTAASGNARPQFSSARARKKCRSWCVAARRFQVRERATLRARLLNKIPTSKSFGRIFFHLHFVKMPTLMSTFTAKGFRQFE